MTAAWSEMMLGAHDPWFDRWDEPADLYLLLDIDLPWVDDGTRLFGAPADRRRFFDLCVRQLDRRGVRCAMVSGIGDARRDHALEAISHAGL
jgi:nicotinamide riboside kinase